MKKSLHYLLAFLLVLKTPTLYAKSDYEYATQEAYKDHDDSTEKKKPNRHLSRAPIKASSQALSTSMMGWGAGLAAAILILSGVIHNSPDHSHSTDKT